MILTLSANNFQSANDNLYDCMHVSK